MEEHKPVLVKEVLQFLAVRRGRRFIDATLGGGGHTEAILQNGGEVLGIDQDPEALKKATRRLTACPGRYQTVLPPGVYRLVQGNFADLGKIASGAGFDKVDGILFDLGFASFQVEDASRGLSFTNEGPLDMRLDPNLGVTAADLINGLPENELYKLFKETGEEKHSRAIARAIVRRRAVAPFKTTRELAGVVEKEYGGHKRSLSLRDEGGGGWRRKIHPATKVFMALRIAVNSELGNLKTALPQAVDLLRSGGRLAVISFHSGEDRIVKEFVRDRDRVLKDLTKHPIKPSEMEIKENPRARSAKLRVAERINKFVANAIN